MISAKSILEPQSDIRWIGKEFDLSKPLICSDQGACHALWGRWLQLRFLLQHEALALVLGARALVGSTTLGYSSHCGLGLGTRGLRAMMATVHCTGALSHAGDGDSSLVFAPAAAVFASSLTRLDPLRLVGVM